MWYITIKGEASTGYDNLQKLSGINCQDEFVEYMDNVSLKDKLINGYLRFDYFDDKLWSIVEYKSKEELSDSEISELIDYTSGQLSDGIGEGFEQGPCYFDECGEDVYISPWFFGQVLTSSQKLLEN